MNTDTEFRLEPIAREGDACALFGELPAAVAQEEVDVTLQRPDADVRPAVFIRISLAASPKCPVGVTCCKCNDHLQIQE